MKIKPLKNRLFVEPIETTRTQGGIIIAATIETEKPMIGRVLAVGPGLTRKGKFEPSRIEAGEIVIFARNAGQRITVDGREVITLVTDEILGVLDPVG
jgi:chaperonin GroES